MSYADQLVERHRPWLSTDLETYLRAIASMMDEVELFAFDIVDENGDVTDEGWTILFDPDRCPAKALPYLAQYVGEVLPVGISEPLAREWIKDAPNQLRGTPYSIFRAAQRRLTGGRLVAIRERDVTVDGLLVITYTDQTPDPAGPLQDLRAVVPADVVLNYSVRDGQTYDDVKAGFATYDDVNAAYATYDEMRAAQAGTDNFSRPRPV